MQQLGDRASLHPRPSEHGRANVWLLTPGFLLLTGVLLIPLFCKPGAPARTAPLSSPTAVTPAASRGTPSPTLPSPAKPTLPPVSSESKPVTLPRKPLLPPESTLTSPSASVRRASFEALAAAPPDEESATLRLQQAYPRETDRTTREWLVHTLAARTGTKALPGLLHQLWNAESDPEIRKSIATHLASVAAFHLPEASQYLTGWRSSETNPDVVLFLDQIADSLQKNFARGPG